MKRFLRTAALALPIVSGPAAVAGDLYDPHKLVLTFADGHQEQLAATSETTCRLAVRALVLGMWHPLGRMPVSAECQRGSLFSARSLCIPNFNCPRGMR